MDRESNLRKAINHYKAALNDISAEKKPYDYSYIMNGLGTIHGNLADIGDRDSNLKDAVDCFERSINALPQEAERYQAILQKNLGIAFKELATIRDRETNLKKSIKCYLDALEIYGIDKMPTDYAMAQKDIGLKYTFF